MTTTDGMTAQQYLEQTAATLTEIYGNGDRCKHFVLCAADTTTGATRSKIACIGGESADIMISLVHAMASLIDLTGVEKDGILRDFDTMVTEALQDIRTERMRGVQ